MNLHARVLVTVSLALVSAMSLGATIEATPETYRERVPHLKPGDTLHLQPGRYEQGLRLHDLHGEPGRLIAISGPSDGTPAVFIAQPGRNTVSFANASYIEIRNLVLDGLGLDVAAVRAERRDTLVHHVTIENLTIVRHGPQQQTVGISTAAPTAFWTIRNNVIVGAGTGLYLGGSDGHAPFVAGLIEGNVIVGTTGYNLQIKHQKERPKLPGMPYGASHSILRGNVFAKTETSSTGNMARPNVLLGHFPLEGPGSEDEYRVEENVFHGNPTEALLQAEGNLRIERNLFLNGAGDGVNIQPHNDLPRRVAVQYNVIAVKGAGLRLVGAHPAYAQVVAGNEIFTAMEFAAILSEGHTHPRYAGAVAVMDAWLRTGGSLSSRGRSSSPDALGNACKVWTLPGPALAPFRVIPGGDPPCTIIRRRAGKGAPPQ